MDLLGRAWATSAWRELKTEMPLVVNGTTPHWLSGQYFLASSAGFEMGEHNLTHAFDGFSKILRWRFDGARSPPSLRVRLLQSTWLNRSRDKGDVVPSLTVGPLSPPLSRLKRMSAPFVHNSDNFNVKIHEFAARRYVALSDVSDPDAAAALIDDETLASEDFKWKDPWASPIADRINPAHARIVPDGSGDTVGLVVRMDPFAVAGIGKHTLLLYRTNASSSNPLARRLLQKVHVDRLPYVHSIGITRDQAIVCVGPLNWDVKGLLGGDPASRAWQWDQTAKATTIYRMPLDAAKPVARYSAPPFFAFHHVNAWDAEDGGVAFTVIVDAYTNATHADPSSVFGLAVLRDPAVRDTSPTVTQLRQYTLPPSGGADVNATVREFTLVDGEGRVSRLAELPSINPAYSGRRACFCYVMSPQYGGDLRWSTIALVKKDLCNETAPVLAWRREGHVPGEPTFVPRPSSAARRGGEVNGADSDSAEDDGVIVAATHDGGGDEAYLLVLNATTMQTLAEVRLPPSAIASSTAGQGAARPALDPQERLLAFGIHGLYSDTPF
jgi:beta,beta-carotene 9',10'-dioxygenase